MLYYNAFLFFVHFATATARKQQGYTLDLIFLIQHHDVVRTGSKQLFLTTFKCVGSDGVL